MFDKEAYVKIIDKLLSDSAMVAAVDELSPGVPAIIDGPIMPDDFYGKGVNLYLSTPVNGALAYGDYDFTLSCRANDYIGSKEEFRRGASFYDHTKPQTAAAKHSHIEYGEETWLLKPGLSGLFPLSWSSPRSSTARS